MLRRGRHKKKGSLHESIRIDENLKEILNSEQRRGEPYNDTILRIIQEKGELARQNDRLKTSTNISIQ
jgi:hypothetical protein